jgi:hypothetical protein
MPLVEHRLAARMPVRLEWLLEIPTELAALVRVRDLSRFGAYVEPAMPIPCHSRVRLYFCGPGRYGRHDMIRGTVVRTAAHHIGLEFEDCTSETAALIECFLSTTPGSKASLTAFRFLNQLSSFSKSMHRTARARPGTAEQARSP